MCFDRTQVVSAPKPAVQLAVDTTDGKVVSVNRRGDTVKVVTQRGTGRKDTFVLSLTAAKTLATALQNA